MARSFWKFKFFTKSIWRKIFTKVRRKKIKYKLKFFDRNSHIPLCFINLRFNIYKGSGVRRFLVNRYNVGMKFGEFAFTRKPFHFPIRKKKSHLVRR